MKEPPDDSRPNNEVIQAFESSQLKSQTLWNRDKISILFMPCPNLQTTESVSIIRGFYTTQFQVACNAATVTGTEANYTILHKDSSALSFVAL